MIRKKILPLAFVSLCSMIVLSLLSAYAANISVPATRLTDQTSAITANALKPAACSAITLTAIFYCPADGTCNSTDASELVIGTSTDDDIRSGKGNDCIVGGGGNDSIRGEQDTDVCIGGPGTDSFHASCETENQ